MLNSIKFQEPFSIENCKEQSEAVIQRFVNQNFDKYFIKIQKQIKIDAANGLYKLKIDLRHLFGKFLFADFIDFYNPKYKRLSDKLKDEFIKLNFKVEYHTIDYLYDQLFIYWE